MNELPDLEFPEELAFLADRVLALNVAHMLLKAYEIEYDVSDLLETAAWLAGDNLPDAPTDYTPNITIVDEITGNDDDG